MATYKIMRFKFNGTPRTISRGLSLEQAQRHCKDPTTHKHDSKGNVVWFDGYTQE